MGFFNLVKQNDRVEIDDKVKDYLAQNGYDAEYGARPLKRLIQREIEGGISNQILHHEIQSGDLIKIDLDQNDMIKFSHVKSGN